MNGSDSAYAVALYTSLSRLQANSHYARDVVAGATIGIAFGRAPTFDVGQQRLQMTPTPVHGGMAVRLPLAREAVLWTLVCIALLAPAAMAANTYSTSSDTA